MVPRLLVCSILLILVWNVNSTPVTQAHTSSDGSLTIPFLQTGEKKYYLVTLFKANWFKAMQYCHYHGLQLATITSKKENTDLLSHITNTGYAKEHFWTSGTNIGDGGKYFWMANGRSLTYMDWLKGEPNNYGHGGEQENCLEIADYHNNGLKWNDERCSLQQYFVCEA